MGKATRAARKGYRQAKKSAREYGKRLAGTEQGLGYKSFMKTGQSYGDEGSQLFQEGEASANYMQDKIGTAKSEIKEAKISDLANKRQKAISAGRTGRAGRLQDRMAAATEKSLMNAKYGASVKDKYMKGGSLRNHNRRKQT